MVSREQYWRKSLKEMGKGLAVAECWSQPLFSRDRQGGEFLTLGCSLQNHAPSDYVGGVEQKSDKNLTPYSL